MQALTSSKRFSIPSKAKQETDDIESVRLLLNLSCKGIPPVECEQNRGHGAKANNGRRMSFQNWKICGVDASHEYELTSDDAINLRRQVKYLTNVTGNNSATNLGSKMQRRCNSNWLCCKELPKKKDEVKLQKHEKGDNPYIYNYVHCDSPHGHIKRYRREVTLKVMEKQKSSSAKNTHSANNCVPSYTRLNVKRRNHECTRKASSALPVTEFSKSNELTRKCNSFHTRYQRNKEENYGKAKKVEVATSCARAYNIPSITLPASSIDKITECHMSWELGGNQCRPGKNTSPKAFDGKTSAKSQYINIIPKANNQSEMQGPSHHWRIPKNAVDLKRAVLQMNSDLMAYMRQMNSDE